MSRRAKVIAGIVLGAMLASHFIWPRILFEDQEIAFCRTFVLNNAVVREQLGSIRSIKLVNSKGSRSVEWSTEVGKSTDGDYHFWVKGTEKGRRIRVHWQKKQEVMKVTRLSMRQGLAGTRILWPEAKAASPGYVLPSHIWDGFISSGIAGVCLLFYFGLKKHSKWAEFVFFIVYLSDKMRAIVEYVCVLAACISAIESVLCFLNVTTLF